MKNYLTELRSFYKFVATNFYNYKQNEIKTAERAKILSSNAKLRKRKKSGK